LFTQTSSSSTCTAPSTPAIYTLSLHDALPIYVGGGGVRRGAGEPLQQGAQQREHLHVAVVAGDLLPVRRQVERIDEVEIVQIRGRGLVGEVHRVLERQVPDRERLELRVPGADPALMVVVDLREA